MILLSNGGGEEEEQEETEEAVALGNIGDSEDAERGRKMLVTEGFIVGIDRFMLKERSCCGLCCEERFMIASNVFVREILSFMPTRESLSVVRTIWPNNLGKCVPAHLGLLHNGPI